MSKKYDLEQLLQAQTYREALSGASSFLSARETDAGTQIARWLLVHLLQVQQSELIWHLDHIMPREHKLQYKKWIERVASGEPYQYIMGSAGFFGREFEVNPSVLIPRPETECLLEVVLDKVKALCGQTKVCGVDVGTGSGAIAISLALEYPQQLQMAAVDISEEALQVARRNARKHGAAVRFMHSDVLDAFLDSGQKVNLIVSNPPYIAEKERDHPDHSSVDRAVLDYEPLLALFAGKDGLYFYREIIRQSLTVLDKPGLIAFEVGWDQAAAVGQIIQSTYPQAVCAIHHDLRGIERIVTAIVET